MVHVSTTAVQSIKNTMIRGITDKSWSEYCNAQIKWFCKTSRGNFSFASGWNLYGFKSAKKEGLELYGFKSAKKKGLKVVWCQVCQTCCTNMFCYTYIHYYTNMYEYYYTNMHTDRYIYITLYIALLYAPPFPLDPSRLFKLLYFDSFWIRGILWLHIN